MNVGAVNGCCCKKKLQVEERREADEDSVSSSGDENKERGNWSNQLDFVLSCIGYAVGLGNIWRFPYLCMRNGGGAFIIPYFSFLFLCGIPLFFMELSLGQFSSLSPVSVWNICPLFKGLGWGMIIVSGIVCVYYNIIITWVLHYLFASFTSELPWGTCGNDWNTPRCIARGVDGPANVTNISVYAANDSIAQGVSYRTSTTLETNWTQLLGLGDASNNTNTSKVKLRSSAEEYFHFSMLELSDGVEHLGGIKWQLLLCLILSWVLVFACLCKGVKSSGKVVYVTATVPYVFLVILFIRGLLLPGALEGVRYYIVPKWSKLLTIKVWQEAALQIFFSLGPAWGGLITMSSYNRFHNNLYRDAMLVPVVNCGTSFFAGFVIFSVLGYMSHLAGISVEKVASQGPGLAFIVYPEALTRLPISPVWAIVFFLMLLTIGLDSQFGMFETVISGFADEFAFIRKRKTLFAGILCCVELLLGLPMVTRAGMYIFQILDWYSAAFSVMTIALCECIIVAWVYGAQRLYDEIEMMIGFRPCYWWILCWRFITPALMVAMLVYSIINLTPPYYGDYHYPSWVKTLGWCVASISLLPIPVMAFWEVLWVQKGTLLQRLKKSVSPEPSWGPALEKYREAYYGKHFAGNGHSGTMTPVEMENLMEVKAVSPGEEPPVKR